MWQGIFKTPKVVYSIGSAPECRPMGFQLAPIDTPVAYAHASHQRTNERFNPHIELESNPTATSSSSKIKSLNIVALLHWISGPMIVKFVVT